MLPKATRCPTCWHWSLAGAAPSGEGTLVSHTDPVFVLICGLCGTSTHTRDTGQSSSKEPAGFGACACQRRATGMKNTEQFGALVRVLPSGASSGRRRARQAHARPSFARSSWFRAMLRSRCCSNSESSSSSTGGGSCLRLALGLGLGLGLANPNPNPAAAPRACAWSAGRARPGSRG